MSLGSLRLRFLADGDGTGRLVARAEANGFAGASGAYFDVRTLEGFAISLGAFPLSGRPSVSSGFYSRTKRGELEQEHLSIACYPVDGRGHLAVHVRLATELWPPARPESQHVVALEMMTTYAPLGRFSRELLALLNGRVEEAVLEGDVLP
jgi:hypothetical protein